MKLFFTLQTTFTQSSTLERDVHSINLDPDMSVSGMETTIHDSSIEKDDELIALESSRVVDETSAMQGDAILVGFMYDCDLTVLLC